MFYFGLLNRNSNLSVQGEFKQLTDAITTLTLLCLGIHITHFSTL